MFFCTTPHRHFPQNISSERSKSGGAVLAQELALLRKNQSAYMLSDQDVNQQLFAWFSVFLICLLLKWFLPTELCVSFTQLQIYQSPSDNRTFGLRNPKIRKSEKNGCSDFPESENPKNFFGHFRERQKSQSSQEQLFMDPGNVYLATLMNIFGTNVLKPRPKMLEKSNILRVHVRKCWNSYLFLKRFILSGSQNPDRKCGGGWPKVARIG